MSAESSAYWEEKYSGNDIWWHMDQANPILVSHIAQLTGSESGESRSFFVPLCGKTRDIPYLLSLGHRVFALEAVLQPILELAAENSLNLKQDPEESLYYTEDGRLKIYNGDLFKCPIEKYGPFDCVWDRGSFVALHFHMRQAYVDVLKRSLQNLDKTYHHFKYLLQTVTYDKSSCQGHPYPVFMEDMERFYGSWAYIELLDKIPREDPESQAGKERGDESSSSGVHEVIYMIGQKNN